jgi:hypothetical protein
MQMKEKCSSTFQPENQIIEESGYFLSSALLWSFLTSSVYERQGHLLDNFREIIQIIPGLLALGRTIRLWLFKGHLPKMFVFQFTFNFTKPTKVLVEGKIALILPFFGWHWNCFLLARASSQGKI